MVAHQRHHLLGGVVKCSVCRWGLMGQVWRRKSLVGAPPIEVGVLGCHHLLEGFVEALCFIPPCRPSVRATLGLCCAYLCFSFLLTLVCPPRVLVSPQSSSSSQRLPGRWRTRRLLRSGYLVAGSLLCSGYLVAGGLYRLPLRSGYLIACEWMLSFLPVDALPPRLHSPSVGDHYANVSFFGRHSWLVFCGGGSPVYSCCSFVSLGFRR
jgi:hypothetical protein